MKWSPQQENALKEVNSWLASGSKPFFYLGGYAGSGKTTLARHFAEGIDGGVRFAAFTGKAAHVLQQKGCDGAQTIHSLIYQSKNKSEHRKRELQAEILKLEPKLGDAPSRDDLIALDRLKFLLECENKNLKSPAFTLKTDSEIKTCSLVVIDECSMVDQRIGADLLSFGVPVLVLGDPAQLPPVKGGGYFTSGEPDLMLTEIHRQARENPILRLASDVRQRRSLRYGDYGDAKVVDWGTIEPSAALGVDQVLVGRNATRHKTNRRMRELLHRKTWQPEVDDRLVCLRNNSKEGLLNGALWNVTKTYGSPDDGRIVLDVEPDEGGAEITVEVHDAHFRGESNDIPYYMLKEAQEFDYGYALTCHKAQGSQWDNVMVFDESGAFRQNSHRWLYTAITRAAKKLTVVTGSAR